MKLYAQFFTHNLKNEVVEALGSDGYLSLDARYNAQNALNQAEAIALQRNANLKKGFCRIEIRRGNFRHYTTIAERNL